MAPKANLKHAKKPKVLEEKHVAKPSPPRWPLFQPLVPKFDLSLTTLVENQIVLIPKFWTASLCKTYVSFLSTLPLITTPGKPKKGEALRVNDRFQIDDPDFAERLWSSTALKNLVLNNASSDMGNPVMEEESTKLWGGAVVGLNPRIRIYRYGKGQYFGQHCR